MENWMSTRWLAYLEQELLLLRMTPGQARSAERGDARLTFASGTITAEVEVGKQGAVATATLKIRPFGPREWGRIEAAIAGDPEAARRLLGGNPGPELEALFNKAGASLFPAGRGRHHRCTCGERWGCRHQRVLAVRAGRLFDANPFLWFAVLGRGREELLAGVRAHLADQAGPSAHLPGTALAPLLDPDRFLATEADPGSIPVRSGEAAVPDALLRLLGPLPLAEELNRTLRNGIVEVSRWGRTFHVHQAITETAEEVLARYYAAISAGAAALAVGDRAPVYRQEPVPGKRLPLRDRLVAEVVEAVDAAETCLEVEELMAACPTAAALPWEGAHQSVSDAVANLPDGYLLLGGQYVGRRDGLLAGAAFRHVVTWPEWQRGRLSPEGEWCLVLTLAGYEPPFLAEVGDVVVPLLEHAPERPDRLFGLLKPEVGDELLFTVADAVSLRLRVRLHRRADRSLLDPLPADQSAARYLATFATADPYRGLAGTDAIELLLAGGFYRPGRTPDPVWLLPSPAVGENLRWGPGQRLVASYWGREALRPGGEPGYWRDGPRLTADFGAYLAAQGLTRWEAQAAAAMTEAWIRHWPGNPLSPNQPPPLAAFLHFLFNMAPVEARRLKLAAQPALQALGHRFRFLGAVSPSMAAAYQPFLDACGQVAPFRHRLQTVPPAHTPEFEAWEMEGFRWLGPRLAF